MTDKYIRITEQQYNYLLPAIRKHLVKIGNKYFFTGVDAQDLSARLRYFDKAVQA